MNLRPAGTAYLSAEFRADSAAPVFSRVPVSALISPGSMRVPSFVRTPDCGPAGPAGPLSQRTHWVPAVGDPRLGAVAVPSPATRASESA